MRNKTSRATKERLIARHLARDHYATITREDGVWLCENTTAIVMTGGINKLIHTKRTIGTIDDDDNVWALRHSRKVREWYKLDAVFRARMEEPKAKRQAIADEESADFKEKFGTWADKGGYYGKLIVGGGIPMG